MALTFKLEEGQAERLIQAINRQADATEDGFTALAAILSGDDDAKVNELINRVRAIRASIQSSVDKHEGE